MVELKAKRMAVAKLFASLTRAGIAAGAALVLASMFYGSCTARVLPNEQGVEQVRFGSKAGIAEEVFGPGLYFIGPGTTMHTFPREIHLLEASNDHAESLAKAHHDGEVERAVDAYFAARDEVLGSGTHRRIEALNVQTSDGYSVSADVSLLYSIKDPVKIAREFGWGSLYVDGFVVNTFRNGVLATLGKMSAEDFYGEEARVRAIQEAEKVLAERFEARGLQLERLLLQNYHYSEIYEKSLQDKKVAVQLTVKNKKEGLVNEERAKLQQIESKGTAAITIAESEVNAKIARVRAEAQLYSSQVHAKADQELGLAGAEAKRLKADALTQTGGRYVLALETAKMFDNIESAVMTPEQYVAFIRNTWALIGLTGSPTAGER